MSGKPKILVVDDEDINLKLMTSTLEESDYFFETASNGVEALDKTKSFSPDLIFLDVIMPEMDGFEVCKRLKNDVETRHIPVVMVTGLSDRESKLKGLSAGANDFLTKPFDHTELLVRSKNLLKVKEFEDFLKQYNQQLESEVEKRTRLLQNAFRELSISRDKLKESYRDSIFRLTIMAEYRDKDTSAHIKRVGHYCHFVAEKLGWPEERQDAIFYASPMHDIGKVAIPAEILLKQGCLMPEEYNLIKTHTTIGADILGGSDSRFLRMAEVIALTHHESWDGSGYPYGLQGEKIPMEGRVMHLVDVYDALRSKRPYKNRLCHKESVRIMTRGNNRTLPSQFDPQLLRIFEEHHDEFERIYEKFQE